ncbi:SAM-dependent methyltransferase [Halorhabdus sp. SVX81]|nr:SAM-dependent methyltransferase [Halorhabdus sp. SVX81]
MRAFFTALTISAAALGVRLFYFFRRGVVTPPDSSGYLQQCAASINSPFVLLSGDKGLEYAGFLVPFCGLANVTGTPLAWVAIQLLLGSLTAGILYLTGRRLFSARAGVVAGGLWVLMWDAFRWDVALLSDSVFVFIVALTMYAFAYYQDEGSTFSRVAVLLGLGYMSITRPFGPPILIGWLAWDLLGDNDRRRTGLLPNRFALIGGTVAISVVLILFTTRTAWITDHVFDVYRNGWIFWKGRNAELIGSYTYDVTEATGFFSFVISNIHHLFVMGAIKVVMLFYPGPLYVQNSPGWFAIHLVSLLPTILLGWLGVVKLLWDRHRAQSVVLTPIVVVTGIVAVTFIDAGWRYRAPLLPAMCLAAGYAFIRSNALMQLWDWTIRQMLRAVGTPPAPLSSPYRPDTQILYNTVSRLPHEELSEIAVYGYLHPMLPVRELFYARGHLVMKMLDNPTRYVDVGCGPGLLLHSQDNGVGVDIRPTVGGDYLSALNDHSPVIGGDISSLPIGDGSTEAVVAMDVLEHLTDLSTASDEIERILTEDGSLIVCGPTENLFYKAGRWIGDFNGADHKTTVDDINKHLKAEGWQIVKERKIRIIFPLFTVYKYKRPNEEM